MASLRQLIPTLDSWWITWSNLFRVGHQFCWLGSCVVGKHTLLTPFYPRFQSASPPTMVYYKWVPSKGGGGQPAIKKDTFHSHFMLQRPSSPSFWAVRFLQYVDRNRVKLNRRIPAYSLSLLSRQFHLLFCLSHADTCPLLTDHKTFDFPWVSVNHLLPESNNNTNWMLTLIVQNRRKIFRTMSLGSLKSLKLNCVDFLTL